MLIETKNAELLRYVRSELRPARVAVIMGGTVGIALLLALFISANTAREHLYNREYWQSVYGAIVVASSIILVLWSLLNASQAVVSERTHRTFDFWRTTQLSPLTLAVGKLFGAPIGAWLQFATALPIAVLAGVAAGVHFTTIVGTFLIVALCNVTLSALALCLSMRAQDSRRATMVMLVLALCLTPGLSSMRMLMGRGDAMTLSAWSAFNPIPALVGWHAGSTLYVGLFGYPVLSLLVTILLCAVVIAWSLVALARSIKLEPDQSSLFSPAHVIGISLCYFLFTYAAYQPSRVLIMNGEEVHPHASMMPGLIAMGIGATMLCLYFTVVSTLRTRDRLRQELRINQPQQIAWQMVAPWLVTGGIGLVSALLALAKYRGYYADEPVRWMSIIGTYLLVIAYAVRDGMFLEWMIVQRVKAPVLKGSVLLGIYYVGSGIVSALVAGPKNMWLMWRWLAPIPGNPEEPMVMMDSAGILFLMLIPPLATAALLAMGVFRKMHRGSERTASPVHAQ
jgi:hypothetical protein